MSRIELTHDESVVLYSFLSATLAAMNQQDIERMGHPFSIDVLTTIAYKLAVEMDNNINEATND